MDDPKLIEGTYFTELNYCIPVEVEIVGASLQIEVDTDGSFEYAYVPLEALRTMLAAHDAKAEG